MNIYIAELSVTMYKITIAVNIKIIQQTFKIRPVTYTS